MSYSASVEGRTSLPISQGQAAGYGRAQPVDLHMAHIRAGQKKAGVETGADRLMEAGLETALMEQGRIVGRTSHVSDAEDGFNGRPFGAALADLADAVETSLRAGRVSLTLGGDHSLAFASLEGALRARPDLAVLYIDAHADINTPATSPSGNTHGMPIAAHLGLFEPSELPVSAFVQQRLRSEQLAFIGIRDLDPDENRYIAEHDIACFTSQDVKTDGGAAVLDAALKRIDPDGTRPLYVSFDIDVCDPALAPATGVPVADGLEAHHVLTLARALKATGRVIGMDLVEINPNLAPDRDALARTLEVAKGFIAGTLAEDRPRPAATLPLA